MEIAIFHDTEQGWGHAVRSQTLANKARERGHNVQHSTLTKRKRPPATMKKHSFDWIVIDTPKPPPWVWKHKGNARIALLNGVGHKLESKQADLVVIQGISPKNNLPDNTIAGPEYVILRPSLAEFTRSPGYRDVVFGGAKDKLGLLHTYTKFMPHTAAFLLQTPEQESARPVGMFHHRRKLEDDAFLGYLAIANRAIIAMGMTAWECAYLRTPAYVFSLTKTHLKFAQAMERAGLVRAYGTVGLPEIPKQMLDFLETPSTTSGDPPDLNGAERIIKRMEQF